MCIILATYGYLDGEYVFSAALLLVMVNAAFPPDDTNTRTMEMALALLRGMADRGNVYLASRHALLLELQASISPKRPDPAVESPVTASSGAHHTSPTMNVLDERPPVVSTEWPLPQDLSSVRDISFNFDVTESDPGLWEEVLDQIDIDMDTDWIESTLRR